MIKPRLFIASASESLDVAYALQEELDRDAEVTIWNQDVFKLSRYTLDDLTDKLDTTDFGLFVLTPHDVVTMRNKTERAPRDNVLFELGLFIGRIGRHRCFILLPNGTDDLHLPTDLLGITPALYEAERTDGNLRAAVGPAANKVRRAIRNQGPLKPVDAIPVQETQSDDVQITPITAVSDCLALIEGWFGQRSRKENFGTISYSDVDRELRLQPGATKKYITIAARRWHLVPRHVGDQFITFEYER